MKIPAPGLLHGLPPATILWHNMWSQQWPIQLAQDYLTALRYFRSPFALG
jgi:hypothetical protein